MEALNILMISGLVPWHPQAGGGQIIAYKLSEAIAQSGHNIDYLAIAPSEFQQEVKWGRFIYFEQARFTCQLFKSHHSGIEDYDIVHLHQANETIGFYLGLGFQRLLDKLGRLVFSVYSPMAHRIPRSFNEACSMVICQTVDIIFSLSEFAKKIFQMLIMFLLPKLR